MRRLILALTLLMSLSACEQLGIPDPRKDALQKEADGKAIGGACRQSGRALEDCYALNPTATKAAIFTGWREMNDYMTENKLDIVKPELPQTVPGAKKRAAAKADTDSEADDHEPAPDKAADKADKAEDGTPTRQTAAAERRGSR
ncbi:MAG: hypothetical protein QM639_05135 [Rhodocyclaceae bacterium]